MQNEELRHQAHAKQLELTGRLRQADDHHRREVTALASQSSQLSAQVTLNAQRLKRL